MFFQFHEDVSFLCWVLHFVAASKSLRHRQFCWEVFGASVQVKQYCNCWGNTCRLLMMTTERLCDHVQQHPSFHLSVAANSVLFCIKHDVAPSWMYVLDTVHTVSHNVVKSHGTTPVQSNPWIFQLMETVHILTFRMTIIWTLQLLHQVSTSTEVKSISMIFG